DPLDDRIDLIAAQRRIVLEALDADVRIDAPGRHLAIDDALFDGARPGTDLLIGEQRHRRHLAGTMAALTGALQDRRDIPGERQPTRHRPPWRLTAQRNRCDDEEETGGSSDPIHTVPPDSNP